FVPLPSPRERAHILTGRPRQAESAGRLRSTTGPVFRSYRGPRPFGAAAGPAPRLRPAWPRCPTTCCSVRRSAGGAPAAPPPAPAPAVPAEPEVPEYLPPLPAERSGIPSWVVPILALLPIWAFAYVGALSPPSSGAPVLTPLQQGAQTFAKQCSPCHGANGE